MNQPRDDKCARLYQAIIDHCREHVGAGPGLRELARLTGIPSTNTVSFHLMHLEDDGLIVRPYATARSIQIVGASWVPYEVSILVEALQTIADEPCCETPGCCPDNPMCTAMLAKGALQEAFSG